jgi:hypothetical protein
MATWVKAWDLSYYNISQLRRAHVDQWVPDSEAGPGGDGTPADNLWWLWADNQPIRGQSPTAGFATRTAAQTFLDSAIASLGGSV